MPASTSTTHRDISAYLIAHNRTAYQLFEDLAANNIIGEHHLCLLRRIVYDCKGDSSCTTPQAVLARRTKRPRERVKRHLREVERTGWLRHQREGNTWRTIVTAFLPLDQALEAIADARRCDTMEARRYLEHLQQQGVRLPWELTSPKETADDAQQDEPDLDTLIQTAQAAHAAGEPRRCAELLRQAATMVEQHEATTPDSTSFFDSQTGCKTPPSQGTHVNPATRSDTFLTSQNHESEQVDPPQPPVGKRARNIPDTEVTRLLIAERVFAVEEFAVMPLGVVQAVLACDDIANAKDEFRPHRIVKRLRLAQQGLWTPSAPLQNMTQRHAQACPRCARYVVVDLADVGCCRRCGWCPEATTNETTGICDQVDQNTSGQIQEPESVQSSACNKMDRLCIELCEVWRAVQQKFAANLPRKIVATWLEPCRLLALDAASDQLEAVVGAPNVFVRDEIVAHYRDQLEQHFADLLMQPTQIRVVIQRGEGLYAAKSPAL